MNNLDEIQKTYSVSCQCKNCGHETTAHIPKGSTIEYYLSIKKCPNCGCEGFFETKKLKWTL